MCPLSGNHCLLLLRNYTCSEFFFSSYRIQRIELWKLQSKWRIMVVWTLACTFISWHYQGRFSILIIHLTSEIDFFQIASECVILNHTWQNHTWQNPTEEMGGLALACQALSIWLIHCPHMKPWLVRNILPKLNLTFKLFCYCISTSFKNDSFERKKQNTLA